LQLDVVGERALVVEERLLDQPGGQRADADGAARQFKTRRQGDTETGRQRNNAGGVIIRVASAGRAGQVQLERCCFFISRSPCLPVSLSFRAAPLSCKRGQREHVARPVRRGAQGGAVGDAQVRLVQERLE